VECWSAHLVAVEECIGDSPILTISGHADDLVPIPHTDTSTFFDVQGLGTWDNSTGTYAPQEYRVVLDLGWNGLLKRWAISSYAYTPIAGSTTN
jgi:hypothetical protein